MASYINEGDKVHLKADGYVLVMKVIKVDEDRNLYLLQLEEVNKDGPADGVPF